MATSTTESKKTTGVRKDLTDKAQQAILDLYNKQKGEGVIGRGIAGLSENQKKALGRLEGGEATQDFQRQLSGILGGTKEGQEIIKGIATGKDKLTPEQITAMTQQFMDTPGMQQQMSAIDTTAQQNIGNLQSAVGRQLEEGALPSIYRGAAGSGNVGSSRSAIAEGVARRGAAESMSKGAQNILSSAALQKAGLRGKAYDQALATALGVTGQQRAERAGAAGQLTGLGMEAGKLGAGMDQQTLSNLMAGGALEQAQRQGESDEAYRRRLETQNKQAGALGNYIKMLNQIRGVTDTSTQQTQYTSDPSTSDVLKQAGVPLALGLGAKWIESKF